MNQPDSTQPPELGLETQMSLGKVFIENIKLDDGGINGAPRVVMSFSVDGQIPDPVRREEIILAYRLGIEEAVPELATRLGIPLVSRTDSNGNDSYDRQMREAIEEAMRHVGAVFEGTHRWSPLLAKEANEDPNYRAEVFSGCQISLVSRYEPVQSSGDDPDDEEEPQMELRVEFIFCALLYDLTDTKPEDTIYPLDSDPRVGESEHGTSGG